MTPAPRDGRHRRQGPPALGAYLFPRPVDVGASDIAEAVARVEACLALLCHVLVDDDHGLDRDLVDTNVVIMLSRALRYLGVAP